MGVQQGPQRTVHVRPGEVGGSILVHVGRSELWHCLPQNIVMGVVPKVFDNYSIKI